MSTLEYCEAIAARGRSLWKNIHNCKLCVYSTTSFFFMVNHMRRHRSALEEFTCDNAKIEAYYCKDCDFKTELTILFKQHICKHHALKRETEKDVSRENFRIQNYVCEKCDFETNLSLKWFQRTLTCTRNKENLQNVNFSKENITTNSDFNQTDEIHWHCCAECPHKSKFKTYLIRHIQDCHLPKRYECDKCPFKSRRKVNLKRHLNNLHLNDKDVIWYKCNECSFKTKNKASLKRHGIIKHIDASDAEITWYECQNCSYKTKQAQYLKSYVIYKHLNDEKIKWYKCGDCSFKAKTTSDLTKHVKKHCPYNSVNNLLDGTEVKW
ncbi:zinc finger X-chromosomal protein-like [Zophobas morio]|uniref:zinc finger X-chromosomal protein-like n=1 Tax=Zophobas morio TaxID=2755281 RepID=UPI003082CDB0